MEIFISYSSDTGTKVASLLRSEIQEIFKDQNYGKRVTCHVAEHDVRVGTDWPKRLRTQLQNSKAGVFILDPASQHSPWMPWELQHFELNESALIYPLLFGIESEDLVGPFALQQAKPLSRASFLNLVADIADRIGGIQRDSVDQDANSAWERLEERLGNISSDRNNRYQELMKVLVPDAHRLIRRSKIDQEDKENIEAVLDTFSNNQLTNVIGSICGSLRSLSVKRESEVRWDTVLPEYADICIMTAAEELSNIASGPTIRLRDREAAHKFWTSRVLGYAEKSIWTTNLPGTFGRDDDPRKLRAQEKAINKSPEFWIHRLFIYDNADLSDLARLNSVIQSQIDIDISVGVINASALAFSTGMSTSSALSQDAGSISRTLGSLDFMIIDEKFVYTTFTGEKGVVRVEFTSSPLKLKIAMDLKEQLEADSDIIKDIAQLPWVQQGA